MLRSLEVLGWRLSSCIVSTSWGTLSVVSTHLLENECIEKALNGTELVPEYYLELTDSMCGLWRLSLCHSVSPGVWAHVVGTKM